MSNTTNISNNGSNVNWDSKNELLTKRMTVSNNGAWGGQSVTLDVEIDFKGVSLAQVYAWAAQTLIINLQQTLRKCDYEFVKDLSKSVYKRKACAMGILDDPNRAYQKALDAIKAGNFSPDMLERMLMELQSQLPGKKK